VALLILLSIWLLLVVAVVEMASKVQAVAEVAEALAVFYRQGDFLLLLVLP
jgi:hypothetical protein